MDVVVGTDGTEIRQGCEVILSLISYYAGIAGVKVRVVLGKTQDFYLTFIIIYGETDHSFLLDGALGHAEKKPGLSIVAEDAGIEETGNFHSLYAGAEVAGTEQRIGGVALCDIHTF